MDCRDIVEMLHAFHDGELGPGENWIVEEHLSLCDSCRRALSEIKEIDQKLLELPGVRASSSFDEQLARRMKKSGRVYRLLRTRAVQLALAASVMLAIGIAALNWPSSTRTQRQPFAVDALLPNLNLLDDGGFLGIGAYNAGVGDGLEVSFAASDSQDKEE